jgi:hypothetical protein
MAGVTEVFITSMLRRNTNAKQDLVSDRHNFQWRAASHGIIGNSVAWFRGDNSCWARSLQPAISQIEAAG